MIYQSTKTLSLFCIFIFVSLVCCQAVYATDSNFKGWEIGSRYNDFYNYKERDSLKGKVLKLKKVTPLDGMAAGTALILEEGDDKILVHLCPWDFADPKETGIRKGVKTKIKGSWAEIDGEDVFIAAKVKQGETFVFKVRLTKDGTPFWTLSPEELEKERNSTE